MKRITPILQFAHNECGACCLAMLLNYYNIKVSPDELSELLKVGRDGLKLVEINECLRRFGCETKVYECNLNGLFQMKMPLILTWKNNHYVVLEKILKNYVIIIDPSVGRYKCSFDILQAKFTGYAISSSKSKGKNIDFNRKEISFFKLILNNMKEVIYLCLFSLLIYLLTLCISFLVQQSMDNIQLLNKNIYLFVILLVLSMYFCFSLFTDLKKKNIGNHIYHKMYFSAIDNNTYYFN